MKTLDEITKNGCVRVVQRGEDGMAFKMLNGKFSILYCVLSFGEGWDHVSVHHDHRCPDWNEMTWVRDTCFLPEETVMQLHPPASRYVNIHPFCLHLWRPQNETIPMPPIWMV